MNKASGGWKNTQESEAPAREWRFTLAGASGSWVNFHLPLAKVRLGNFVSPDSFHFPGCVLGLCNRTSFCKETEPFAIKLSNLQGNSSICKETPK